MGKYSKYERPEFKKSTDPHPIWWGIGCLLIILTIIISYAGAELIIRTGLEKGWPLPKFFYARIFFPDWFRGIPLISTISSLISAYHNLPGVLILFVVIAILLSGVFTTLYAFMRRITGPSRYTPVDAPPSRHKPKQYKR